MIKKPRFVFGILPVFYGKSRDSWAAKKGRLSSCLKATERRWCAANCSTSNSGI